MTGDVVNERSNGGMSVCRRLAALGGSDLRAPKLLVVLAHPDDETIAVGGRMDWLCESRFVGVTDGAPQDGVSATAQGFASTQAYAAARQVELAAAFRHAGLPQTANRPLLLGGKQIADKQAWESLVALTREISRQIRDFEPDAVLTHPFEGGHPDHDACAFAVHRAVQRCDGNVPVIEAPFYHRGPCGFTTGVFRSGDAGVEARLSVEQAANKRARLDCFVSQAQTLAPFSDDVERFRVAPRYDFTQPPHEGGLNYETFGWGMTGEQFCAFAADAQRELDA